MNKRPNNTIPKQEKSLKKNRIIKAGHWLLLVSMVFLFIFSIKQLKKSSLESKEEVGRLGQLLTVLNRPLGLWWFCDTISAKKVPFWVF